jgi:hypothetical protein
MAENTQATPRAVMPGRVKTAEAARNFWVATVEQGTKREDIRRPEFWALVAKNLRPYDRIELNYDDGSVFAEYLVLSADRAWAKVHELRWEPLGTQDVSLTEAAAAEMRRRFKVVFRGQHLKHCVERTDGTKTERLKEGCQDVAEATAWLEGHLKTIGASALAPA